MLPALLPAYRSECQTAAAVLADGSVMHEHDYRLVFCVHATGPGPLTIVVNRHAIDSRRSVAKR